MMDGRSAAISVKEAQKAGLNNFGKLWTVGLLSGVAIVLGTILLVVPGVILIVPWLLGLVVFHVAGGLIHLLLIIAVIAFVVHLFNGRRTV